MICRFCVAYSENVYNFFDGEGLQLNIVDIIAKYFWFQPKPDDTTSHLICDKCWKIVRQFHELYLTVKENEISLKQDLLPIKTEFSCNSLNEINSVDNQKIFENDIKDRNIYEEEEDDKDKVMGINSDENENISRSDDSESDNFNEPDNDNNSIEEEIIKPSVKRRGRPPNPNKKICTSKKKKEKKLRTYKRSSEERAAYTKKITDGDELIAKFMKIYCNVCSMEQINFTALKHHCTSAHGKQGIVMCCERKFYRKSKLVEHIEKHVDPQKHKCHICDHVSANRWNLKIHMDCIHKEEQVKPFQCADCGKYFKIQSQLLRHELIHLPEEERKFKCSYCEKNFPSDSSLKYHIRLCHEGYYSGVCDICGKAYNNRQDLKRHRRLIHEGVERSTYKCKNCDKEFTSKYTYNIHRFREHEKHPSVDFKCKICNKVSANSEALKNHVQYVHKAKAKFECTLCKKVFKRELALKEHTAAHVGQSLYTCPHCPKTFTHSSNMHHHRKLKHPIEFEVARKSREERKEKWIEVTSINNL